MRGQALSPGMPSKQGVEKYLLLVARPDPSELRSRREERMENGVKNLKGARQFPKTLFTSGIRDAYVFPSELAFLG
jgi:hypothetical protein